MSVDTQTSQKSFMINIVTSLGTKLLQITLLVWVNQYLLRRVDPEEYSLLPLVMSLLIFADIFRNMFVDGLGRFMVEADAKNDGKGIQQLVSSMWPLLLLVGIVFGFLGGVAIFFIDEILAIDAVYQLQARIMLGLLVCMFCLDVLLAPFSVGLYVKQKFVHINAITLMTELVRIVIVLSLLLGVGPQVMWLVCASFTAQCLNLLIRCYYTRKLIPDAKVVRGGFSPTIAKQLMGFGAWSSVGNFTNFAMNTVPILLLGHFGTAIQVSMFHLGRLPEVNIRKLAIAAVQPAQPMLTARFAMDGKESLNESYFRGGRYHLWATLLLVAPLVVFAETVSTLYAGETYAGAGMVMVVLFLSYPVIWASAMFYRISHATGDIADFYKCEIFDAILKILLVVLFVVVLKWGALGAALGITIATVIVHLWTIWPQGLKMVSGRWSTFFRSTFIPGCGPFAGALVVSIMARFFFNPSSWLSLGAAAAAAVTVYLLVMLFFCADDFDKGLVKKMIMKLKKIVAKLLNRNSTPVKVDA
ncbi:MAG: hypothetical protein ACSHX0_09280 [Akkermansiaceae bacterium]